MRKNIIGCVMVLTFGALVSGGCAKKEIVRADEAAPAVRTTVPPAAPEVVRPMPAEEAKPSAATQQPLAETPTREMVVKQEPVPKEAQVSELQTELQKIYFNFDSADLSEDSRRILSKNAEDLAKQPSVKIRIEGNCDERGSDEYNMALGERRAKAAKDYLVSLGVQPERISILTYGEEKPVDPGHDEAAWAKNRRDEFVIVK
jgi:peptidoglycan-associated lipoprotein